MQHVARPRRAAAAIPRGVWALGFVSLFMDISSEMIHALLPVFLVGLGASVAAVGLLEGTAEAIAQVTKVFSGTLSDRLGKRKLLTAVGYGLAALTKPLFALAPQWDWATRDGSEAIQLLSGFRNVTVFYGHIHHEHHHMTGHIAHHAAMSTMFPLSPLGTAEKKTQLPWNAGLPYPGANEHLIRTERGRGLRA